MSEEKLPKKVQVKLSIGKKWAKKFRDSKEEKEKIDAYLIPLESLEDVLKLKASLGIDAARAYVGINDLGEQILMFVGAKYDDATGIYRDVFAKESLIENSGEDVVYDATRPCPPYGDEDSPMNQ